MNEVDEVKQLRLQEELRYVDVEQVERWSRVVLDRLVRWSNQEIFSALGGEVSIELPLGPPNAGVSYVSYEPLRMKMMIRMSMVTDIYRDAFTFPLISRRVVSQTDSLAQLHSNQLFNGKPFLFSTGVPEVDVSSVYHALRPYCEAMVKVNQEQNDSILESNDLHCRFVMFELMLVWTFFHELGHVVQKHFRLRADPQRSDGVDTFLEFDEQGHGKDLADHENDQSALSDLKGQARELMADAEAADLTIKYLVASRRLNFSVVYLLLCSISCMFQRFYMNYSDELSLTRHSHPHPAVRDNVFQHFVTHVICDLLAAAKQTPTRDATGFLPKRSSYSIHRPF